MKKVEHYINVPDRHSESPQPSQSPGRQRSNDGDRSEVLAARLLPHLAVEFPVVSSATKTETGKKMWLAITSEHIRRSRITAAELDYGITQLSRDEGRIEMYRWGKFFRLCTSLSTRDLDLATRSFRRCHYIATTGRLDEMTATEYFAAQHWLDGTKEYCLTQLSIMAFPTETDYKKWWVALQKAEEVKGLSTAPRRVKGYCSDKYNCLRYKGL